MPLSTLLDSLKDNPYFGAGFGLFGLGMATQFSRKAAQFGMVYFRRNYMMTLEVPIKDRSYHWLLMWLGNRGMRVQHMSVDTTFSKSEHGKVTTGFQFLPSPGSHFFWHKGHLIRVDRSREQSAVNMQTGEPFESVTLTTLGRNRSVFVDMLVDARGLALEGHEGKTTIYTARGTSWTPFGHPRDKRPLSSVVLDKGVSHKIVADIKDFIINPQWYKDRGIPYRRGYLLHGPPGCGKSSFITALAGHLEYGICTLNLSEYGQSDDRLQYLLSIVPQQCIILLEDVDAAFVGRDLASENPERFEGIGRLTFSGVLNALDGVGSAEASIVFMTTNHIERLDPALIRPGRVDFKQYIGYSSESQVEQMFRRFYPDEPLHLGMEFAKKVTAIHENVSSAELQGHFLFYKDDAAAAMENISALKTM